MRSGAAEKPVTLSTASRIIRPSGYFVRPAVRGARSYVTCPLGKPSQGTSRRYTRCWSGSALSASTAARLNSRKSPAWAGTEGPARRRMSR
ncbi:hypothetical protein STENM36S_08134 [Streptomyces tendae]